MKPKHITAFSLCILLALQCSCGSAGVSEQTTVGTDADTSALPETDYLEELTSETFDGVTFRIMAQHTSTRPNFSEDTANGEIMNDSLFERDRTVEELLGITIENLPYTDRGLLYTDLQKSIAAQDYICDMVITSMSDGINKLAPNGYLLDLSEYASLSLYENWWCPSAAENLSFDGHIYFTTGPISLSYYTLPVVVAFNKRLAEDYGVGNIYDKVNVLNLDSKSAVDVIQSISDRMNDKTNYFIADDFDSADYCVPIFEDGRSLFLSINMGYMMFFLRDMEDDFGIVPIPKYDETQDEYVSYCNTWMPAGVAMPITNPDPERSARIMETLAYLSYKNVAPAVYEVTLREKVARDSDSSLMMELIFDNTFFDVNAVFDFGGSSTLLRKSVLGKAETYVSSYESIKAKTESALQDMISLYSSLE